MAYVTLNWTPAGGANSTGQTVQYKLPSSGTWITHSTVSASASTANISGLTDNTIYDFRILNNCNDGGPTGGSAVQGIWITCPTVTYTEGSITIGYSFAHLGSDITKYVLDLLDATGTTVLDTKTHTSPSGTITGTFTGLTPSTNYGVRVTVYAGSTFSWNKTCPVSNRTTAAPSPCDAPTGLTVTMEAIAP